MEVETCSITSKSTYANMCEQFETEMDMSSKAVDAD